MSLHFLINKINQCIFYALCLLSGVVSDTNTRVQDFFCRRSSMMESDASFGNLTLRESKTSEKAVPKYGNV